MENRNEDGVFAYGNYREAVEMQIQDKASMLVLINVFASTVLLTMHPKI